MLSSRNFGMPTDFDTVVIGAGVIGLAIARSLAMASREVVILEQHRQIGTEVSSRNSEVIHAGLYYPTGSLRARLCVAGKHALYDYCAVNGVPHQRIGKLLVATDEGQLAKLGHIAKTAKTNGVDDLEPVSVLSARQMEPEVACVAALLSPSTGIIDSHAYMLTLLGEAEAHGASLIYGAKVRTIEKAAGGHFVLKLDDADESTLTCQQLVVAAGLHASALLAASPIAAAVRPPPTFYARGQYYSLVGRSPFRRLVYPIPDGAWLGIHVTIDLSGRTKFGPDIEWIDGIDYAFNPANEQRFYQSIRRYWPGLPDGALQADYTGIRPKLYREGEPVPDFRIDGPNVHAIDGLVALYGIESPGLTASLAIGAHVAGLLAKP